MSDTDKPTSKTPMTDEIVGPVGNQVNYITSQMIDQLITLCRDLEYDNSTYLEQLRELPST